MWFVRLSQLHNRKYCVRVGINVIFYVQMKLALHKPIWLVYSNINSCFFRTCFCWFNSQTRLKTVCDGFWMQDESCSLSWGTAWEQVEIPRAGVRQTAWEGTGIGGWTDTGCDAGSQSEPGCLKCTRSCRYWLHQFIWALFVEGWRCKLGGLEAQYRHYQAFSLLFQKHYHTMHVSFKLWSKVDCQNISNVIIHDHPLYLVCPNMLSLVGELLLGDGCGSSNHV